MKTKPWNHVIDNGRYKTSEILDQCRKYFKVYSWYDDEQLDKDFPPVKSDRTFAPNIEADETYANQSAEDVKDLPGITLRERLLMELGYFQKTGKHLDVDNITLCSGSRHSGGCVPDVDWSSDDQRLYVGWYYPTSRYSSLRARVAVTLDISTSNPSDLETRLANLERWAKNIGYEN